MIYFSRLGYMEDLSGDVLWGDADWSIFFCNPFCGFSLSLHLESLFFVFCFEEWISRVERICIALDSEMEVI